MGSRLTHLSLMHGWIPMSLYVVTLVVAVVAIGWRTRRWRLRWLPLGLTFGVATAFATHWYLDSAGLAGGPAPTALWWWVSLTGLTAVTLVAGWRDSLWWRRIVSLLTVPLSLLCAATTVNDWVGYYPTVAAALTELTSGPLPDQTDRAGVSAMQQRGKVPPNGVLVPVTIEATSSQFKHRQELVYLPPAWFSSTPPPPLPAVIMIGGEFNTPTDWPRAGDAITTLDAFAAAHGGQGPVVAFVDSGGGFNIDTECVNGPRGNAGDHLTKDVVPYLIHNFGVSAAASHWGVVGFSAGGTCAIDLAVMHPELFHDFVDIAGDLGPNSGNKEQTISRLFGGSLDAWQAWDPKTVIARHGQYQGVSGLFVVSGAQVDNANRVVGVNGAEHAPAKQLCDAGSAHGISCSIIALSGKHDWPCAGRAFTATLPWLAGQLTSPATARVQLSPTVFAMR